MYKYVRLENEALLNPYQLGFRKSGGLEKLQIM